MLTAVLVVALLLVPGYLVSQLVAGRDQLFLQSISVSYLLFIVLVKISRTFEWTVIGLGIAYCFITITLVVLLLASTRIRKHRGNPNPGLHAQLFSTTLSCWTTTAVFAATVLCILAFGIYDEVPSDLYQHLAYANNAFHRMDRFGFGEGSGISAGFSGGHRVWYVLVSWLALIGNTSLAESHSYIMMANTLLFLLGVAAVADRIFRVFEFSRVEHQIAVLATVVFLYAQMGLSVISYVRYYSFAPTAINFIVYFAGLVCILNLYERRDTDLRSVAFLFTAVAVTTVIHIQECLFIVIAAYLLGVWWVLKEIATRFRQSGKVPVGILLALLVLVAGALGLYLWIRFNYNIRPFTHSQILTYSLRYIGNLYVLDPTYRFYLVVTSWGLFVYLLFFAFLKRFTCQPFLVLAMLSPLVTVFNPLFADVFVRLNESGTLWRLGFFVPLHFVAGVLVVLLLRQVSRRINYRVVFSTLALSTLLILLLPSAFSVPVNAHAKTTLIKPDPSNSWRYWQDLIAFLEENDFDSLGVHKRVLVDPVTGYVINALTRYRSYGYKFLPTRNYYRRPFAFETYEGFPLSDYSNQLIIVNTRDGGPSTTGERSGHWHRDVLRVSDYYPDGLLPHLEGNPDRFEKLWSADRIQVYRIR